MAGGKRQRVPGGRRRKPQDGTMATEAVLSLYADEFCAWVGGNANYERLESVAGEDRICASLVSRAIPLALRALGIVEAILAGKQPASLMLKDLMAPSSVE
jgi:hypothetical protein